MPWAETHRGLSNNPETLDSPWAQRLSKIHNISASIFDIRLSFPLTDNIFPIVLFGTFRTPCASRTNRTTVRILDNLDTPAPAEQTGQPSAPRSPRLRVRHSFPAFWTIISAFSAPPRETFFSSFWTADSEHLECRWTQCFHNFSRFPLFSLLPTPSLWRVVEHNHFQFYKHFGQLGHPTRIPHSRETATDGTDGTTTKTFWTTNNLPAFAGDNRLGGLPSVATVSDPGYDGAQPSHFGCPTPTLLIVVERNAFCFPHFPSFHVFNSPTLEF